MPSPVKATPREWYRITCQADASVAEIWIYERIGRVEDPWTGEVSGIGATDFLAEIKALPESVKTLKVHINSPGGNWSDSIAIANMLRELSKTKPCTVETITEAMAASGASVVFCAGDVRKVASNAVVMIHNPSGLCWGEAKDMRSMADGLDAMRDSCVATYRWVSSLAAEAIQALMDKASWMSAEDALANGFASEIIEPVAAEVHFDPRSVMDLGQIPEPYRTRVEALLTKPEPPPAPPQPADPAAILTDCAAAGCSVEFAQTLVSAKLPAAEVAARIAADKEQRQAEAARQTEIRGLCAAAKLPELADGYITARMPAADVKVHLTTITAKMDAVDITTTLPVDGGNTPRAKSGMSAAEVYEHRRLEASARAR